jgi:hypothetical protein
VTLDPIGGNVFRVHSSEFWVQKPEFWSAQARLRFGTTRHVAAVQTLAIKIGLELGSFSFFEKVEIGEIVNV